MTLCVTPSLIESGELLLPLSFNSTSNNQRLADRDIELFRQLRESATMPNWPTWTKDEEIVLVFFLSCGIQKRAVRELIAYKCNTARRDEQDMKHHVFQLHNESKNDSWNGSGPLLVSRAEAPRSHAAVPDVWAIDWKDSWKEKNVDDWLIRKTCRNHHLDDLTVIGREEEDIICEVGLDDALIAKLANKVFQEQEPDEIDWNWVEYRQGELVDRHLRDYDGNYDSDDDNSE